MREKIKILQNELEILRSKVNAKDRYEHLHCFAFQVVSLTELFYPCFQTSPESAFKTKQCCCNPRQLAKRSQQTDENRAREHRETRSVGESRPLSAKRLIRYKHLSWVWLEGHNQNWSFYPTVRVKDREPIFLNILIILRFREEWKQTRSANAPQ